MHAFLIDDGVGGPTLSPQELQKLDTLEASLKKELNIVERFLKKTLGGKSAPEAEEEDRKKKAIDIGNFRGILESIQTKIHALFEELKGTPFDLEQVQVEINALRIAINNALAEFQLKAADPQGSKKSFMAEGGSEDPIVKFLEDVEKAVNKAQESVS